jgi:(p)ppGpp synthase/HD superfamily hydrolase
MKTTRQIELAIQIVLVAFAEKIRIGKVSIPSATHSIRVGLTLLVRGYAMDVCLGGFFHDLLEDTLMGASYIKSLFGERVDYLMQACTIDPKLGDTPEGEQELFDRVVGMAKEGDLDPLRIKCEDSLDNLRSNNCLKREWQLSALERGKRWADAACRYFPDEILAHELKDMVAREGKRIFPPLTGCI